MAKKYDIENYYFIDFENVTKDGLNGIENLGVNDRVRVYYGKNAAHIPFDLHLKIVGCAAQFEYEKVEFAIKNALDCMILYDIRAYAGVKSVKNYFIVSKDSDFDEPIKTFRSLGLNIHKINSVGETPSAASQAKKDGSDTKKETAAAKKVQKEKKREDELRVIFDNELKDKKYKENKVEIFNAVLGSKTKIELNNKLQKIFSSSEVKEILKKLKPFVDANIKKSA